MSRSSTRKVKKQDPELIEFVEDFQKEFDVRATAFSSAVNGFWPMFEAQLQRDIEEVGQTLDLNMTVGEYFEFKKAAAPVDENREPEQLQEQPMPLEIAPGAPHVALPGGGEIRFPEFIRPKMVEGVFNLRQPKPNEIAFSLNGTPLQMTSRIKEERGEEEEPMEYAECD